MPTHLGRSPAILLPALLGCVLLAGPASAQAPAARAGDAVAFADAHSVSEIAHSARGLRLGARLHLEGVRVEPGEPPVGLDLVRFEVFAPDGKVVVHGPDGEEERRFPANAYFRGRVIGEPGSLAVLTVLEDGTARGIVRREGEFWELGEGPPRADGSRGLAARSVEAPEDAGFECATDELTPPQGALEATTESSTTSTTSDDGSFEATTAEATTTSYTARVAVETDFELYQDFGGNTTALTDYVGDLFAYASSTYDAELATDLQVTHLSVWETSADPYQYVGSCGLFEFGRFWNDNRTGIERTISHFVSGKSSTSGVAWVGVLCRDPFDVNHQGSCSGLSPQIDNYGGAYGFSAGISGSFDLGSPSPVWDIVVVSHEIGHNFNSPHTHCYNGLGGSSSPVDECYNGQSSSGCYDGTARLPGLAGEGSGTIMSYCHALSPGLSNIGLTFGAGHPYGELPQRVPDRMRAHVESIAASAPACLERIDGGSSTCEDVSLPGQTVDTPELYEACGTLSAGTDGFSIVDPGDVTLRGSTVVLESGFSVGSGANLRVETH